MVRNLPSPSPKQTRGGDGDGIETGPGAERRETGASADEAISIGPTDNLQFAELRLPGIDGIGVFLEQMGVYSLGG